VAHYLVRAATEPTKVAELAAELARDAFVGLQPFGVSLTEGLEGARWESLGVATWEEADCCSPPLAMERAAVLDRYFTDLRIEPVERDAGWAEIDELERIFPTPA
jgi:hypothetical protein